MEESGFRIVQERGVTFARSDALSTVPGMAHAFSTRVADSGLDFDLGSAESPTPEAVERRSRLLDASGFASRDPVILRQVHGAAVVDAATSYLVPPEADAVVWVDGAAAGPAPAVRTADCVPVLLLDRAGRGAAAVHAGWKGVAARVVPAAIDVLTGRGLRAADLVAATGPSIGACCYEVGRDVLERVAAASPGAGDLSRSSREGHAFLDLHAALRAQLLRAGVPAGAIHRAPWCTRCREDLFFSHRRDGGKAGRMMSAVGPARS